MRSVREIVLPETEPETEWIGNRPVRKVSPTRRHSMLQAAFLRVLEDWAGDRGAAGAEWRFRAAPPGEDIHPLVPDVAYLSYDRLRLLSDEDREVPPVAPEIVVEILSPDDRRKDVDEKRRVYFAWGVRLEIIADPQTRSIEIYDAGGGCERVNANLETCSPAAFPDLRLPLRAMFAKLEIPDS
jgi:Uma2 family endonuclease